MPKPVSVEAIINDDRGRQNKALARWEAQKDEWDRLQRGLARRVGKTDGSRTLQGSTHEYRMRTEELGMIDSSVPAEVKNGVSAWEMNLRASSGGVRYVQVGSSYPYPLYCPIRDAESVKPDNHSLMRVIPPTLPERHKPVSSGEYFQSRQHEFGKHIKKKFGHYTSASFFGIEGTAPPLVDAPVPEDPNVAPVGFYPADGGDSADPAVSGGRQPSVAASMKDARQSASQAPSRPLSAVVKAVSPAGSASVSGPMIVLSTAHLHFNAAPGETTQATLRVENTGSTAVFYSWSACEGDAALPLSPSSATSGQAGTPTPPVATPAGLFRLSDVSNAVLLPDDTKFFTVSFRSPVPGIFSQLLELLTVPAGRERIVIHLRAVVVGGHGDGLQRAELDAELAARAPAVDAAALLNEVVLGDLDNPFETAAVAQEVRAREAAVRADEAAAAGAMAGRRAAWEELNAALGLAWTADLHGRFEAVHARVHELIGAQDAAPPAPPSQPPSRAPTPGGDALPRRAPDAEVALRERAAEPWSGGIRDLLEDAAEVRDPEARALLVDAINALVAAAAAQSPFAADDDAESSAAGAAAPSPSDAESSTAAAGPSPTSFGDLTWLASGRLQLGRVADAVQAGSIAARDIADGRPTVKTGLVSGGGGKAGDKGAKGGAPAKGGKGAAPAATSEVPESSPASAAILHTMVRRSLLDAVVGIVEERDRLRSAAHRGTALAVVDTLAHRAEEVLAAQDRELEPLVVDAAKGKKK